MAIRWLVAVAWLYVVVLMAAVEATGPRGSLLGAFVTLLLYGLAPLALVFYLLATPARRRRARARSAAPDQRDEPPGDAVAPEREEA
jgi:hypothetical protein